MMHMTFYWGKRVTILFDSWKTDSWTSYVISLIACFLISAFYQYMEERRLKLKFVSPKSPSAQTPLLIGGGGTSGKARTIKRYVGAAFFCVNAAIGYLLMLAIMSFNAGVFLAVVLGLGVGYLLFRGDAAGEGDTVIVDNPCACA